MPNLAWPHKIRSRFFATRKWMAIVIVAIVIVAIVTILAILTIEFHYYKKIPNMQNLQSSYKASDVLILDRYGKALNQIRNDHRRRNLDWLKIDDVSLVFEKLLLQSEDQRFFYHPGFDPIALLHAAWSHWTTSHSRGGSTLTMQLFRQLVNEKKVSSSFSSKKNILYKIEQIFASVAIELKWSKKEIIEAYLNYTFFRGEVMGLKAASFKYFNKGPMALNSQESALLIALIRSPNAPLEKVKQRACRILGELPCLQLTKIIEDSFLSLAHRSSLNSIQNLLPVFNKNILAPDHQNNASITTSIDGQIQELALQLLREQLIDLKKRNVNDGAILVLDSQTGEVLAYVANAGSPWTEQYHVDGIQAYRQVGSTIKPFIYATAFDMNILNLNSLVEDTKADIPMDGGSVYHPQNYDHSFRGLVGAGEALASSLNVPAIRTLLLVGSKQVISRLKKLGITHIKEDYFYGPSLALGTLDASLWDLTNAYRRMGFSQVFKDTTRDSIFTALSLPEYRRYTFGFDSPLDLSFPAAVKTGTSKDMRDNWCVGWSSKYTVGVWVGNFNGQPMWNVSGMTGAAPLWHRLMQTLHHNSPHPAKSEKLNIENQQEVQADQYQAPEISLVEKNFSRILYPVSQMTLAYDPSIPAISQKILIELDNFKSDQKLYLNGQLLKPNNDHFFLDVKRGKFKLSLQSSNRQLLDEVQFEVR